MRHKCPECKGQGGYPRCGLCRNKLWIETPEKAMKQKLKSAAKGAALGALLIAAASILWGCENMPKVTVVGRYADYSYSPKGGVVVVKPRIPGQIIIHSTK